MAHWGKKMQFCKKHPTSMVFFFLLVKIEFQQIVLSLLFGIQAEFELPLLLKNKN